jgi:site-specific recombinase XerD
VVNFEKMDIEYLISVFERKLMLQRYSAGSIKNYSSSVKSLLQVAEKRFDQPDELNEIEIEKYVYRKTRKDHISSSYRFANVLFCAWTIFIFLFLSLCSKLFAVSFFTLAPNGLVYA